MLTWCTMCFEFISNLSRQNNLQNSGFIFLEALLKEAITKVRALACCLRGLNTDEGGFRSPFFICKGSALTDGGCALACSQLGFQEHKVHKTKGEWKDPTAAQRGSRLQSWAGPCSRPGLCNLSSSLDKTCEQWWWEDARMLEGPTQEDHMLWHRLFGGLRYADRCIFLAPSPAQTDAAYASHYVGGVCSCFSLFLGVQLGFMNCEVGLKAQAGQRSALLYLPLLYNQARDFGSTM